MIVLLSQRWPGSRSFGDAGAIGFGDFTSSRPTIAEACANMSCFAAIWALGACSRAVSRKYHRSKTSARPCPPKQKRVSSFGAHAATPQCCGRARLKVCRRGQGDHGLTMRGFSGARLDAEADYPGPEPIRRIGLTPRTSAAPAGTRRHVWIPVSAPKTNKSRTPRGFE